MEEIEDDCWIFTKVPSVVLNNGKNAINADFVHDKNVVNEIFNETSCIYFYEEYWCASEPYKTSISKYFHDNFDLAIVDSVNRTAMGFSRTFTLYKITECYLDL